MLGIYVGATSAYAGKNLVAMGLGLKLQKDGYRVGYMKPIGALPFKKDGKPGDEDAFFVQEILGLDDDPRDVTPVVVDQDFMVRAFSGRTEDFMPRIEAAYAKLAKDKDVMIVSGSGSMFSGKYCNLDGVSIVKRLGIKSLVIDRFDKELKYDYLAVMKETLGDHLLGAVLNDIPPSFMRELTTMLVPFFEQQGIHILGTMPSDPLMGAIRVEDLCDRLGGKLITAQEKKDRVVENFLIGTMQVENFMTHFKKSRRSAVIVGGDRSDVHLVALEGQCECLVLTGNLYPNDIIMTRAEVLGIPLVLVKDDTYAVAQKMEAILSRCKLRDTVKIQHGAQLVASLIDFEHIREQTGLT
ncbi:phosphotransacetylase family protein [Desulfoplanes sp.]